MKRTLSTALVAAAMAALPSAASAAPSSGCPANAASGYHVVNVWTWEFTPEGQPYADYAATLTPPVSIGAILDMNDGDGDDLICVQIGPLMNGNPPFLWPGLPPFTFRDDLRVA